MGWEKVLGWSFAAIAGVSVLGGGYYLLSSKVVRPEEAGLKIHTTGSRRGDIEVLSAGRYWDGPTFEIEKFPTFTQTTSFNNNPEEGAAATQAIVANFSGVAATVGVNLDFLVVRENLPDLFRTYRQDMDGLENVVILRKLRGCFNSKAEGLQPLILLTEERSKFLGDVQECTNQGLAKNGKQLIEISNLQIEGTPQLPQKVQAAIERTLELEQLAEQEKASLAKAKAETARKVLEANTEAKVAKIQSESLTPEVLRLKELELKHRQISLMEKKWDGKLPQVTSDSSILLPSTN